MLQRDVFFPFWKREITCSSYYLALAWSVRQWTQRLFETGISRSRAIQRHLLAQMLTRTDAKNWILPVQTVNTWLHDRMTLVLTVRHATNVVAAKTIWDGLCCIGLDLARAYSTTRQSLFKYLLIMSLVAKLSSYRTPYPVLRMGSSGRRDLRLRQILKRL